MKGLFITFEGVEGCGKSTQMKLLHEHLTYRGRTVVVTREPGGTPIAESIRALLLDPENAALGPTAELLLYEAARAQHVHEKIRPAIRERKIVLCDRFADSTTAYQGAGRGLKPEILDELHRIATDGIWPDHTFLIDLDPEQGLERVRARGRSDRIEGEALEFHHRVRQGYLELARREPRRVTILDGGSDVDAIQTQIRACVDRLIAHHVEEEHELF